MSFILDALKKSESARQRKEGPESAHIPTGHGSVSTPRWLIAIGILLTANVLVLLVFLLKPAETTGKSVPDTTDQSLAVTKVRPSPVLEQVNVTENRLPPQTSKSEELPSTNDSIKIELPEVSSDSTAPAEVATIPIIKPRSTTANMRTFNEVRVSGRLTLADLHVDIHVYSDNLDERFVFINMSKYREGATLKEGPLVVEIVPEGVILDHRGSRFLLPRD